MRQILLIAATAFLTGGIATGAVLSQAQPAPPPGVVIDAPPRAGMMGPPPHGGMMGPPSRDRMMGWWHRHGGALRSGPFALIYRQRDRQLAPADVQIIAEAFLLRNGNHSWKVINVAALPDGPIGFSLATAEGSVIGKFTMDPHTGRVVRIG